jgi:hypothetical protein
MSLQLKKKEKMYLVELPFGHSCADDEPLPEQQIASIEQQGLRAVS